MKTRLMPVAVFLAAIICGCGHKDGRSDPYQVYAASLSQGLQISNPLLLVQETETWKSSLSEEIRKQLAGLRQDTLEDFLLKNKESVTLTDTFPLKLNIVLIPNSQIKDLFQTHDKKAYDVLKGLYPGSIGFTRVSQVGFSKDGTQALLYGVGSRGPTGGGGGITLLDWDGEVWRVTADAQIWIS
ncbi:MAG: hypothetical protein K1Y02_00535 [Candidatus Hydrogenedentes bacterium]|nr:hypothetical protein [Candidatus Hydrogenedentota bacterium]